MERGPAQGQVRIKVGRIAQAEAEDAAPPGRLGQGREGGAGDRGGAADEVCRVG